MNQTRLENAYGYEVTVQELKGRLARINRGMSEVKSSVRSIFRATTLVISLIGALQLFSAQVSATDLALYNLLLVITMILYVLMIIGSVYIQNPKFIIDPTSDDWNTLYFGLIARQYNRDVNKKLISSYLHAINENKKIAEKNYWLAWGISSILPIIILLLLWMSLIPRVPSA